MQGRTLLVLFLAAALLAALVYVQREEARSAPDGVVDFAVFEGIDPERVRSISIDHGERHWQVRVERDARDVWMMTDPIAYPADDGIVRQVLDQVRTLRGLPIEDLDDPAKVGLDPPRAVIAVTTRDEAGVEKEARVELGAVDVDGDTVFVRSAGRILRTRRTLDNALLGTDQDFRSRRMFEVAGMPIAILRTGAFDGRDVVLEATSDGSTWSLLRPARGRLDPLTAYLFVQQLLSLRVERFHSDDPLPLASYGLGEGALRIAVDAADGSSSALRFGRVDDAGPWFAAREGNPFVWQVSERDVRHFATTFEELLDYRIVRAKRESVTVIGLEGAGAAKRLYREGEQWRMLDGSGSPESALVADTDAVGDLLAKLERAELALYLPPGTVFVPSDPPLRLSIETVEGLTFGGEFGAPHAVPGATGTRTFRRDGDELVAVVAEDVASVCSTSLEALRTLVLHRLVEREQFGVEVQRAGAVAGFALDRQANVWRAQGTALEARAFAALVDRILSMRARRWLAPGEAPDETGAIDVAVKPLVGPPVIFRIVRAPDGTELVLENGQWAEVRAGLYDGLAALLEP